MSIPRGKIEKLRIVFSSLPSDISQRLGDVFAGAKAAGDTSLPYGTLLDLLPHYLSQSDMELLFFPVSELAVEHAYRPDQVSYSLLKEMWAFFVARNSLEGLDRWRNDGGSLRQLQKKLSVEYRKMWDENLLNTHFRSKLGEEEAKKLSLVFSVLAFAPEIGELVSSWPKEIKDLDDQVLLPLRDLNDLLVENDPDITPFLLFLLKTRLRNPQQILRAIERLSRQSSDLVIVATDMNIIIETLLDEADYLLDGSPKEVKTIEQVHSIDQNLERFGNIIAGSIEEFDISRESSWGRRLYGISSRAVQFWTRRISEAWSAIDKALPRCRTKSFLGGSLTGPDLQVELSQETIEAAVLNTELLRTVFAHASKLGFAAARDKVAAAVEERLQEQEKNLIDMLADPGEIDPEVLQNHFSVLVSITRSYYGDDAADVLSRRGVSASSAAAA